MKYIKSFLVVTLFCTVLTGNKVFGQTDDRISFADRDIWLNGGNVAWINFSGDVGPGATKFNDFDNMLTQVNNHGGNAMRLWLHTNGSVTPAWNGNNVTGPGAGTISDLTALLDAAEAKNIGMVLCLWSFDMLRTSSGSTITDRAEAMLQDSALTQTYINNALIPMVQAVGNHPAVIAWEIFNEPEGMSDEFGWPDTRHVPMSDIQRFINQTAGAIHRTNADALVSNGAVSFQSLALTGNSNSKNYYSDNELISAGKDSLGTLDFYMVHYYDWGRTELSPFHHTKDSWGLNKPVVIGEFGVPEGDLFGISGTDLYETLYDNGYAGALVWQWVDWYQNRGDYGDSWLRGLDQMLYMRLNHPNDIALSAIYPTITQFSTFPDEIVAGDSSTLQWEVYFSDTITLNGAAVSAKDSLIVKPNQTTTYQLIAKSDTTAIGDTSSVTVTVVAADQINRAFNKTAVSSEDEQVKHLPKYATDGDSTTRWSSPYEDNHWIYVDLGEAYDINSVLLNWEVAYGSQYDIQTSMDAQVWNTVYEERSGNGGVDSIAFSEPQKGRFVRMFGLKRGTEFGFSLWEFEVRGLKSATQPPSIVLTLPQAELEMRSQSTLKISAEAFDEDGTIQSVRFMIDGDEVTSVTQSPFEATTTLGNAGDYEVYALAIDSDGYQVQSAKRKVFVIPDLTKKRFEGEWGVLNDSVDAIDFPIRISGDGFIVMKEDGNVSWPNTGLGADTKFDLTLRYRLKEGTNNQELSINGTPFDTLQIQGGSSSWASLDYSFDSKESLYEISLRNLGNAIHIDYVDLSLTDNGTSIDERSEIPKKVYLAQNYPNPFNPTTNIYYELPEQSQVTLQVFNMLGQQVETLVNSRLNAGRYTITFNASELSSGIYILRLKTKNGVQTRKISLIK